MAINFYQSIVKKNLKLTEKFRFIQLQLTNCDKFSFQPGQFVTIKIGEQIYRSYSVASLPNQLPLWEMIIDISPQGPGTKYLDNLKIGDTINSTTPRGIFKLDDNPTQKVILGASGCGIASIKPMVEKLLNHNPKRQIDLYWGLRFNSDIFYQDLFDYWQKKYSNFHYYIVLSKPDSNWKGLSGHITDHIVKQSQITPEKSSIYICGNNAMIDDIRNNLQQVNFPDSLIYFESYH